MRIASLTPAATEILFALGVEKDIVCVDQFSNVPEEARELPRLMGHDRIAPEALATFRPELVLTSTVVQGKVAEGLKQAGFAVSHADPRTLKGVEEWIVALGIILEKEEQAKALVERMRTVGRGVASKARLLPRPLRVYVEEWHDPPYASGNWVPELVTMAGGRTFPLAAGQLSKAVTLQEVAAFDPDLIVISWCGAGKLADKALLTNRPGWGELRAVRAGHVRVIDDSLLNRPGPRLVEGAQQLYGWLFELTHSA